MDTKSSPPGPPVTFSQGSLQGGKSGSAAPVSSVSAGPLPLSPSAKNAVSPVSSNSNLHQPSAKRDTAIRSSGRPQGPAAEPKSPTGPREQPKDLAHTAALTAAATSQGLTQRHRRHPSHKSSSRGPHHQADVVANQEKSHGKRHKPKVAVVAGGHNDDVRIVSQELLSPSAVDNERQPNAPSEENNPEVIKTKVADFLSHVERNSPQRRYESPDEGPRVASAGSAATSENARCDDGTKSKEDGGQSGTTASHDVDARMSAGATANPKAEANRGRKIGSIAESRVLDGKTLVGSTANVGAEESAGRDTVENPGGGREGGAVGGGVHKKLSAVTVVSPHAQAGGIRQTRRESGTGGTPSPTMYTQRTTMTGRNRTRKSVDQRSVYSLSTLKDLATTLRTDSLVPGPSHHSLTVQSMRYFVVCMVSVAVLFTIVVSLLLWIMARPAVSGAPGLCSTPGCAELAAAFESMLNYSVDPCEDMHAFVCSKGIPRSSGAGRSSLSLVANVIRQYELQMVKKFVEGQTTFTASSMVSDFLRVCTSTSKTPPSVEPFVTFFENVFVPWPFGVPYDTEQHPLESVLTLTLNYGISTWFRAYVLMARQRAFASNSSVKPTLFIEAAASASLWLDFVRTVEAVGGRDKYHELFLARYNASLSERASVSKRLAVEKDILSTLDEARLPSASLQPVLASLAKMAAAIPNTAVRNWVGPVGNAPGGLDAHKTMLVVVRDVRILRAIQRLLTAFSLHDLMRHLSWWLVQILTVIGWPQGYVVIAGSQEVARTEVKVECYRMMAERFALLLASESSTMLFSRDSRLEVERFFLGLVDFMEDFASRAPWLSDRDKTMFANMVEDLEIVVWPPDVEGANGTLWLSYESFCLSCKHGNKSGATASVTTATPHMDLIRFWMRANTQFLPLSAEQIERMQLLWHWDPLDLLYYNPWYNRLRVSHAALRSPIYQPSSPELRKANFGGLGTSFFFSVLQMFAEPADDFESDVDVPSWAELGDVARLVDDLNCSAEFLRNVREIIALGLAWRALNASARAPGQDNRRHHASGNTRLAIRDEHGKDHLYDADQLFFLTYCWSRCTRHQPADLSLGVNCNAAVRSNADFRHAFKCKRGSPMAPREGCLVSDFF